MNAQVVDDDVYCQQLLGHSPHLRPILRHQLTIGEQALQMTRQTALHYASSKFLLCSLFHPEIAGPLLTLSNNLPTLAQLHTSLDMIQESVGVGLHKWSIV